MASILVLLLLSLDASPSLVFFASAPLPQLDRHSAAIAGTRAVSIFW